MTDQVKSESGTAATAEWLVGLVYAGWTLKTETSLGIIGFLFLYVAGTFMAALFFGLPVWALKMQALKLGKPGRIRAASLLIDLIFAVITFYCAVLARRAYG